MYRLLLNDILGFLLGGEGEVIKLNYANKVKYQFRLDYLVQSNGYLEETGKSISVYMATLIVICNIMNTCDIQHNEYM